MLTAQRLLLKRMFCSGQTLQQAIKDPSLLIVDVTSEIEFEDTKRCGSLPKGAVNIPISDLASRAKELGNAKERPVIFYCKHGVRAGLAASYAQRNGFRNSFAMTDAFAVKSLLETK